MAMIMLAAGKLRVLVVEHVYHMLSACRLLSVDVLLNQSLCGFLLTFLAINFASSDSAGWGFRQSPSK